MTVRVYRSDDASAPTLSGTVGSLISVLDACLVNGYGSKAASGWAKAFSGTNLAAYRAASGNRLYLRIDDTAAQEARVVGYETMSDVNTGTGPFPTSTQVSGGLFQRKSDTANSTARPWLLIATATAFHLFCYSGDTLLATGTLNFSQGFFFGDLINYKPSDPYATMLIAAESTGASVNTYGQKVGSTYSGPPSGHNGHYMPRAYTGAGTSIKVNKNVLGDYASLTAIGGSSSLPGYPDVITGGIPLGPIEIAEPGPVTFVIRGRIPGVWAPLVQNPAAHLDTFSGSGELSGKAFMMMTVQTGGSAARVAIETSDTW